MMAADFGLLSSAGQLPLKVEPPPVIDPVKNQTNAYNLADTKVRTEDDIDTKKRADSDRAVLQKAMQTGDYDLSHPDGVDSLLRDTQGQLSPDMVTKLAASAGQQRQQYTAYEQHVAQLGEDKIKFAAAAEDEEMPMVGQLLDHYNTIKAGKGEQEAQRLYEEGRGHLAADMQRKGYPPEVIAKLTESDPESLTSIYQSSPMRKRVLAEALQQKDADLKQAKIDAIKNPQDWQQYIGSDGAQYKWNKKAGVTQSLDKASGTWTDVPALPPDAKPVTGLGSGGKAQSPLGKLMADHDAAVAAGSMTPEKEADFKRAVEKSTGVPGDSVTDMAPDEREFLVKFQAGGGKVPIPQYGSGTGTASVGLKKQFVKDFIDLAMKEGTPPDELATTQLAQKAEQSSIQKLKTQSNSLQVVEGVAKQDIANIKKELAKIGGPDSPVLRKYWNMSVTEAMGSPEFAALNPYFVALQDHMSRILAQSTGAGAPAVGYLNLAKDLGTKDQNLKQFMASSDSLTKMMDQRQRETDATIKNAQKTRISFSGHLDDHPGDKNPDLSKVKPADQAKRDSDIPTVLKMEYDGVLEKIKKEQDPDQRRRLLMNARDIRKELKNNKIDVPDPGEPINTASKPKVTVSNW
jgi:hypothetical protein